MLTADSKSKIKGQPTLEEASTTHVAQRLRQRIEHAESEGFEVRKVVLEDESPGWCQLGNKRMIFLDLTATTTEQLGQLEGILQSFQSISPASLSCRRDEPQAA